MTVKFLNAKEAVEQVRPGSTLATDGFVGAAFPEELAVELEKRFLETGSPDNLTLVYCAGQGDGFDVAPGGGCVGFDFVAVRHGRVLLGLRVGGLSPLLRTLTTMPSIPR